MILDFNEIASKFLDNAINSSSSLKLFNIDNSEKDESFEEIAAFGNQELDDLIKRLNFFMKMNKDYENPIEIDQMIAKLSKFEEEFDNLTKLGESDPLDSEKLLNYRKKIIDMKSKLEIKKFQLNSKPENLKLTAKLGSNNDVLEEDIEESKEGTPELSKKGDLFEGVEKSEEKNEPFHSPIEIPENIKKNLKKSSTLEDLPEIRKDISFKMIFAEPTLTQRNLKEKKSLIKSPKNSLHEKSNVNERNSPFELAPHDNTYEQTLQDKLNHKDEEILKLKSLVSQKDTWIEELQNQLLNSSNVILGLNREIGELKIKVDLKDDYIKKLKENIVLAGHFDVSEKDSKHSYHSKMVRTFPATESKKKKIFEPSKDISFSSLRSKLRDLEIFESAAKEDFERMLDKGEYENQKFIALDVHDKSLESFGFNSLLALSSEEQSQAIMDNFIPTEEANEDSKLQDLIYPFNQIKDYYMKKNFKTCKGDEIPYNPYLDELVKNFDKMTIKYLKKACLMKKSVIFSNEFIQIGAIFEHKIEGNLIDLNSSITLFYGNQNQAKDIQNFERKTIENEGFKILSNDKFSALRIPCKHQIKEIIDMKSHSHKTQFLFSQISYKVNEIRHNLFFAVPIPIFAFIDIKNCSLSVFKSHFKDESNYLIKSHVFKLGHRSKPWIWVDRLFSTSIHLNPLNKDEFSNGMQPMKFGIFGLYKNENRIGMKIKVFPDNFGLVQVSLSHRDSELAKNLLSFLVFVLKAN